MIKKCILISCLVTLCQTLMFQESLLAQSIPTPKSYFGFDLGADGKLASWKSIVGYYHKLDSFSDCILVRDLGQSTLGNPFILIIITTPENMTRLGRLSEISRSLANPRGRSRAEIAQLIDNDKQTKEILQNSVFLLFGSFNPDGAEMVSEWVEKT